MSTGRRLEAIGLAGLPELRPGDDLAALLVPALQAEAARDGDVVVVTSKAVSKAEGRVVPGLDRDAAIDAETTAVVAEWTGPRGRTVVGRTRHGLVLASAGVDASNVEPGSVVLLPEDPDRSARALRDALQRALGARLAVVVTDTMGRPWREGLVDTAIGVAGLAPLDDLRGRTDRYGNDLGVTVVAVADEVAAASELVRRKLDGVPAALLRGLADWVTGEDGPGAAALVRDPAADRFPLGAREAVRAAVRACGAGGTPAVSPTPDALREAVEAVRAAVPEARLEATPAGVRVAAADAQVLLTAAVLLRVALAGEGLGSRWDAATATVTLLG